jgi:outer membrane protein
MTRVSPVAPLAFCAVTALVMLPASPARAAERFFVRGGPTVATFDASARVSVAGAPVPGGSASLKNNTGLAVEGGWFVRPDWALSLTVGAPPKAKINGDGSLSAAGLLGTARYGPSALGLTYYAPTAGAFRPYLGAGASYTLVFHVRGSAISDLKVKDGFGPYIQAGGEYRVSEHVAMFADIKKIWVSVDATGFTDTPFGPLPAKAKVALDPIIASTGLSFHF